MDQHGLFAHAGKRGRCALYVLSALLGSTALTAAQTRQPAQLTTLPTTSPQEFDLLDKSGAWISLPSSAWLGRVDPRDYGAKCDGATNDYAALMSAAADARSKGWALLVPDRICFSASALDFGSIVVVGATPLNVTNPPSGPTIECSASLGAACVTAGTTTANGFLGATLRDVAVAYSGTPIVGDAALVVQGFNSILDDVLAYNAWDGHTFVNGLSAHASRLYTWKIYNDHIVQNGFPELYISQARFGMNYVPGTNSPDVASNAFFGITGHNPNGLSCDQCQMNLGGTAPKYVYDFNNLTAQSDGIYKLSNSIVDMSVGSGVAIIHGDGTGSCFRCMWVNDTVNAPSLPFWSMGSGSMNQMSFSQGNYFVASFTLPPVSYLDLRLSNIFVSGTFTADAASGSNATLSNIMSAGKMTVQGVWSTLDISNLVGANYSDVAASGYVRAANIPLQAWTPAIATVGGGETVSYVSPPSGTWTRTPSGGMWASYNVQVSSFSGGSGSLEITGMPKTCAAGNGAAPFSFYSGFAASVTAMPWVSWVNGQSYFNILEPGAGVFLNLPSSAMTNSTQVIGAVTCGQAL